MSHHKGTRKEDLVNVLKEMGEQVSSKETIIQLETKLEESTAFKDDPEFVMNLLNLTIEDSDLPSVYEAYDCPPWSMAKVICSFPLCEEPLGRKTD
ncbi:hypothetical protein TNIN_283231 [Trichonephila inaurata madagascariensis]|uniref:Uncharacterized protein n=1 Tax=Trichonephila inaurata madagascariensis TaxID=2747483 RepID=A0A8X7CAR5_9ARAC|nr:hypothetical protein TNIN_283231 [Trichonephila inaurata madagascariensis]